MQPVNVISVTSPSEIQMTCHMLHIKVKYLANYNLIPSRAVEVPIWSNLNVQIENAKKI